jgi:hypothetical protein
MVFSGKMKTAEKALGVVVAVTVETGVATKMLAGRYRCC